jgi:N-acetylneuraminate synthase
MIEEDMTRAVIAEIGINHDGDMLKAKRLIRAASHSGCKGVKFQYRNITTAYASNAKEIGDEIILAQIQRTYLTAEKILELRNYAKTLELETGISFFTMEDLLDFKNLAFDFDFFKIPSAELLNIELILALLKTTKSVYISIGMHNEREIESIFAQIESYDNWIPMHCISNYPVADHNVSLGYITFLRRKWNREVGYSSHDEHWENNIVALSLGAKVIERHITESQNALGLDHSSSSTQEQFEKIVEYAKKIDDLIKGDAVRVPNQGELLNKQNLGRSYYARKPMSKGTLLSLKDYSYRSPQVGIGIEEAQKFIDTALSADIKEGDVLLSRHIGSVNEELSVKSIEFAEKLSISVPVRLSDYHEIREKIPVGNYEFHLSFKEVESDILEFETSKFDKFSVHLPDYISSTTLIDPFSTDFEIRKKSRDCIERVFQFSEKLGKETSSTVPIVASLAGIGMKRSEFYASVSELFQEFSSENAVLTLQWLPPFAWYFGGSVRLTNMCESQDLEFLKVYKIPVTLDTSHLILGKNYFGFDAVSLIEELMPNILHWHISDGSGVDGEGMQLGDVETDNSEIIASALSRKGLKVIEVWQGHFNDYHGFKIAINRLPKLMKRHEV